MLAMSAGWPTRRRETLLSSRSRIPAGALSGSSIGVSMNPGHTALMRMPSPPKRCDRDRARPITPCFEAV